MSTMDVLTVSDFRLPGGTTHSNAEEIQAQSRLGLRSELIHLNGGLSAVARGLNPRIEGLIRDGSVHFSPTRSERQGRVTIARHPAMLAAGHSQLGPIETEHVVIVVNATPVDWVGREHWRPEEVHEIAVATFGVEPLWAPIGPNVREAIGHRVPADRLRETDWVNIIDVDHWWVDRTDRDRSRPPVVGRHSRASVQKWPEQPLRDLIYPPDDRWDMRVLGWGKVIEDVFGPPPKSWTIHEFGSIPPRDFLADLDFFVYFHHPNLVEAFGRTILEAIASGLPAILPFHFEPLFGAAALYSEPEEVPELIEHLWQDEDAYHTHITIARSLVQHRFSYLAHGRRLSELLGPGRVGDLAPPPDPAPPADVSGTVLVDLSGDPHRRAQAEELLHDSRSLASLVLAGTSQAAVGVWQDTLPTVEQTSLSQHQWEQLAAGRVSDLLRAHPGAEVLLLTESPIWKELAEALEGHATREVIGTPSPGTAS